MGSREAKCVPSFDVPGQYTECGTGYGITFGLGPLYCVSGPKWREIPFSVRHFPYRAAMYCRFCMVTPLGNLGYNIKISTHKLFCLGQTKTPCIAGES